MYLELPTGFATQVAITEKPISAYLPDSNWLLLGDKSVRPTWLCHNMPEPPVTIWVELNEASKRMETLLSWLEQWAAQNVFRNHTLVVVGGGVITDMGGLAASLYMRGISWHTWPTTLLAQIDAGIGGKTAVNLSYGKNLIGTFHHPQRMVVVSCFLDTLPKRHLTSGKWELIKMALIDGNFPWAYALLNAEKPSTDDMTRSIGLKCEIVHNDFRESHERHMLNLGHTLGHAYEHASNFDLLHGEAVGLGTLAACLLSENLKTMRFPVGFIHQMTKHLAHLLPRIPAWEKCLPFVMRDKKNDIRGLVRFILPKPNTRPVLLEISQGALESIHAKLLLVLNSL